MLGKLVVYRESSDEKGIIDLFVHPNAPEHLKRRGARVRQRIALQRAQEEEAGAQTQGAKRVPKSHNAPYDFSQRIPKSNKALYDFTV